METEGNHPSDRPGRKCPTCLWRQGSELHIQRRWCKIPRPQAPASGPTHTSICLQVSFLFLYDEDIFSRKFDPRLKLTLSNYIVKLFISEPIKKRTLAFQHLTLTLLRCNYCIVTFYFLFATLF